MNTQSDLERPFRWLAIGAAACLGILIAAGSLLP